ncbi:MAG: thioredoxin domain-containing protein, partial [Planctomycetes bacterium]|nr:thioredoxin domain-containing protein [Planctomycetota bacterium]
FEGEKVLAPGEGGELIVKFDKSKIESGPVKRLVRFETNDPANKVVRVNFSFEIERTDSEEIRWLRKDLTAVRRELHLLRADMQKVLTALNNPKGTAAPSRTRTAAKKPDTTVYDVEIGSSPILGKADAPVTIVEWGDFQCPFCVREYPKLKEILAAYPDQVRLVFKHKPLSFHKKAKPAHALAQMAMQQGGSELFWKMHDRLMAGAGRLEISDLREYAGQLKLDLDNFDKVMADPKQIDNLIATDLAEAKKCNVSATPTIMINGLKLVDRSVGAYKTRIDELLKPTANAPQPAK